MCEGDRTLSARPKRPIIVSSVSGGKDGLAQTLWLVERYGADRVIVHHQVIPEQWPETFPYVQEACAVLGVRLVAQQVIYEHRPDTERGVRRLAICDVHSPDDIVPWGQPGVVAGVTDLALRRRWPPSPSVRFCTRYFKCAVLDAWIARNHDWLGSDVVVALGERAAESARRAKKMELWPRLRRKNWTAWNWLPVHQWSRREVFRKLRDWGLAPHPAYRHQGMSSRRMYDVDEEGGPRCSCRFCIYATRADVCHQAEMESNRTLLRRLIAVERATGRTWWTRGRAAVGLLAPALSTAQVQR
ncbi:MAG: hypothetical protein GY842_23370 [bacterium]|nr:hypothetical protein [bacterium]